MSSTLKLTVLSPERRLVESAIVSSVTLPGSEGQIQVLPNHAPMIGTLTTGVMTFTSVDGKEDVGVVSTGFFEVRDEEVSVMAETIELKSEIDLSRARKAQGAAESALLGADLDEHKFRKYELKLQRALIRQQVAGREL
jgi:F-type H+-transporting ATPase subunit epsilon